MIYKANNIPNDKHTFFNACGGVSTGLYNSLNVNFKSQDNPNHLHKNLQIIANQFGLGIENIFFPIQTHSNTAIFTDKPSIRSIEADGCITNKKDLLLLVTTADCIPVLLRDEKTGIIGAAHSGWPGSLNGVVNNTISLMIENGSNPADINVALGPSLQQASFETKDDLYQKFLAETKDNAEYFTKKENGYLFDHQQYLVDKIKKQGITNISISNIDTYTNLDYFSYRRNTHKGLIKVEKDFPVQASVIKL